MTDLTYSHSLVRSSYAKAARQSRSPRTLIAALAVNGGLIAALLTLQTRYERIDGKIVETPTHWVDIDPVPPKNKPEHHEKQTTTQRSIEQKEEVKPYTPPDTIFDHGTTVEGSSDTGTKTGTATDPVTPPADPPHVAIFKPATQDPRYADAFHPPYPAELIRQELEGSVTVRVTINEKGRVIAVELVKATHKAFYEETREQALRRWRFRPATSDGTAVQSEQTLTVHFRLED